MIKNKKVEESFIKELHLLLILYLKQFTTVEIMNTMYRTLLDLPLFQGLSQEDFTNILGRVKLHFEKHTEGTTIITSDTTCNELTFVLKGKIDIVTTSQDKSMTFIETFQDTYLIEPEVLFGPSIAYKATYVANTELSTMSIDKSFIINDLFKYEIFRLNFLNYTSSRMHGLYNRLWKASPMGIENKVIHFFLIHSEKPEGEKRLGMRMDDLARNLDDTRLNVSKALNALSEQGLIILNRKTIIIPEMKALAECLTNPHSGDN